MSSDSLGFFIVYFMIFKTVLVSNISGNVKSGVLKKSAYN